MAGTRYVTGDVVATPNGGGVVAAVLTEQFEFPQPDGDDDFAAVSASNDRPAYVVGIESGGSAVYRASSLEEANFDEDDTPNPDGTPETDIIDEDISGLDDLPEGWDHRSVLEYWASVGGSWDECVEDVTDDWSEEQQKQHCSAMKDTVLGTKRWRTRF